MLTLDGGLEGEKWSKHFFKVSERQNLENQTIPELYNYYILMLINQNLLAILRAFSNRHKNLWKLCLEETTSKAATTEFLSKIRNRGKYLIKTLTYLRQKWL